MNDKLTPELVAAALKGLVPIPIIYGIAISPRIASKININASSWPHLPPHIVDPRLSGTEVFYDKNVWEERVKEQNNYDLSRTALAPTGV